MPRRSILSAAQRENLPALPDTEDDLIRYYNFSETDLSLILQRCGPANRPGFAVQGEQTRREHLVERAIAEAITRAICSNKSSACCLFWTGCKALSCAAA